jgi:TPR repeat protein
MSIPVVEKSIKLDAATMIAVLEPVSPPKPVEAPPEAAAVFIPQKAKPIDQKVTFVSEGDEWAKQQELKVASRKPVKQLITDADLDQKITELQGKYQKGDADAAYQLVGLLLKRKRVEEAETALDYAARQRHVPSMLLLGRYWAKVGDKTLAKKWLQAASDAGSKEALADLKTI